MLAFFIFIRISIIYLHTYLIANRLGGHRFHSFPPIEGRLK